MPPQKEIAFFSGKPAAPERSPASTAPASNASRNPFDVASIEWNARLPVKFIPYSRLRLLMIVLLICVLPGLLCLLIESSAWINHWALTHYHSKLNSSLKSDLEHLVQRQQRVERTMDNLSRSESAIRALYGVEKLDSSIYRFGIGGRRTSDEGFSELVDPLQRRLAYMDVRLTQMKGKMDFFLGNFEQIESFLRYKHELWEHTPSIAPADGELTSGFGHRIHPISGHYAKHEGLDIANKKWTPVKASAAGMVSYAGSERGFGRHVIIDHGNGYITKYCHLEKVLVQPGRLVKRFENIGYMGGTGRTTGTHLHYEVHRNGLPQNPAHYILPEDILID